jgi:hypothetical protein
MNAVNILLQQHINHFQRVNAQQINSYYKHKKDKTLVFYKQLCNELIGTDEPPNHRLVIPNLNNKSPPS